MMQVLIRFLIVWGVINAVILPIEWVKWRRCKKANWYWRGYVEHFMWDFTYFMLIIDAVILGLAVVGPVFYWILSPIM